MRANLLTRPHVTILKIVFVQLFSDNSRPIVPCTTTLSLNSQGSFLEGHETFSDTESHIKDSFDTELFFSNISNMNKVSFLAKFHAYTLP